MKTRARWARVAAFALVVASAPLLLTSPARAAVAPGTPYTVGENALGQLGSGPGGSRSLAAPLTGLDDVVDLHGGREHVVALRAGGTVTTWGSNDVGQLGIGVNGGSRNTPQSVPGLSGVTAVATGHYHSLALRDDGSIWTWGLNANGQLGDGTTTNRNSPVRVSGTATYTHIAAGRDMSYAVRSDGTVWAWGLNGDGQLGDGTLTRRLTPVRVGSLTDVVRIAGGRDHGLAVTSTGAVWAWGWNAYGMVGDGTTVDRTSPVQVTTGGSSVTAGAHHSILLKADGTVWAWGRNYRAELGDGTTVNRSNPVRVGNLTGVTAVASGRDHGLAMLGDGTVRAWGDNTDGQLGDGTTTRRSTPVVMAGVAGATIGGGGSGYSVVLVTSGPVANRPPTAAISSSCTSLSCSFSSAGSTDSDGTIVSREWTFGDGDTSSLANPPHTYAASGSYVVTLTVTDDDGDTGTASRTVVVSDLPPPAVAYRAGVVSNRNATSNSVTVPGSVAAGDQLLLFVANAANVTVTGPAGWTQLGTRADSELRATVFTHTATATTAGSRITVGYSAMVKSDLSLVAYSGAAPVTVTASAIEPGTSAAHSSPAVSVAAPSTVVSYFVDKSAGHSAWVLPGTVTGRLAGAGSGSGQVVTATADTAGVAAGTWPGVSANAGVASAKAVSWSVVVRGA
ncbi:PKD domain-containing protein [Nocardioides sp.]|uniref:RCC1 domain-containing protein n=1 Tax=Nocardioides sp. TaxID=35761 RepID=UPI003D0A09D5